MKTLEQILEHEKEHRHEDGEYGIKACKESIIEEINRHEKWNSVSGTYEELNNAPKYNTSLFVLLEELVIRANTEPLFNNAMVLACWELINDR